MGFQGSTEPQPAGEAGPVGTVAVTGEGELGLIAHDVVLKASRATTWSAGGATMVLMDRQVVVQIGPHAFSAERALVRVDEGFGADPSLKRVLVYLAEARPVPGRGTTQAGGPRLLVTTLTTGAVRLSTDLLLQEPPAFEEGFVREGLQRFERHLATVGAERRSGAGEAAAVPAEGGVEPIAGIGAGTVSFHADKIVIEPSGEEEVCVALVGHVGVFFQDAEQRYRLTLTAENAVIFVTKESVSQLSEGKAASSGVQGVYLEDNVVATDGRFTFRASRVYYDPKRDKAVVLDAVLYTWDVKHEVPLYLRAQRLRRESAVSWEARQVALTTSGFAEPHVSIAADRLTLTQATDPRGVTAHVFTAEDTTLRWGRLPLFYWPYLEGDAGMVTGLPLRRLTASYNNEDGPRVQTAFDLFALLGRPQPQGVDLLGGVDYLGEHGPGLSLGLDYDLPRMYGKWDGYVLLHDTGTDNLSNRRDIDIDGETRGYALWRHRQEVRNNWELSLELAYVSDETFLEEFFPDQADTGKPFETSLYLKQQQDDWAFTFLTRYDLLDFTAQLPTLQAPGYTVEKVPEVGFYRVGTSVWRDRLTYFTENRVGRVRVHLGDDSPADRGFSDVQSLLLFGLPAGTEFADDPVLDGIPSRFVTRADSRHELQAPMKAGPFDVVPYIVGRVTAYDDDFEEFSGEDDHVRLWTTAGLRTHLQLNRTHDSVESPLLNLHRLREVVEPRAEVFWSGSTIDPESLPAYDSDVEALHEGGGVALGVRLTLQTQRGGAGRWRSVDWVVLDHQAVLRTDDADVDTLLPRFFRYRPELSPGGDQQHTELRWMLSDDLAVVGEQTYNGEEGELAEWRIGAGMQHTPRLSSYVDYADLVALSSRLMGMGLTYELTSKYRVALRQTVDFDADQLRDIEVTLERRLPQWRLLVVARHDELEDEQTFGVLLIPEGVRSSRLTWPSTGWFGR